jgi:bifunctional non-homologous end joining protein LigD
MPTVVGFIEPMLLLRTDALPDDASRWAYQIKLDGYRAIAFKKSGTLHLRSRNDNDFSQRYPAVIDGLARLPDNTVIDGEVVAFDEDVARRSMRCRTTVRLPVQ